MRSKVSGSTLQTAKNGRLNSRSHSRDSRNLNSSSEKEEYKLSGSARQQSSSRSSVNFGKYIDFHYLKHFKHSSMLKQFVHVRIISQNRVSEVHLVMNKATNSYMCLKVIDLSMFVDVQIQLLKYNLKIMSMVSHPNILKVSQYSFEENTALILSEYVSGGEYLDRVVYNKSITEKIIAKIIKQILSALQYAQSKGVYHLDLKPENILLAS